MTGKCIHRGHQCGVECGNEGHIAKPVDTAALYRLLKKSMEETE